MKNELTHLAVLRPNALHYFQTLLIPDSRIIVWTTAMRYILLTSFWMVSIACSFLVSSVNQDELDILDDLSFTWAPSTKVGSPRLISDEKVRDFLADRLETFPKSQIPRLARHIISLSQHFRFDPAFILSLIQVESNFKVKALSPMGALGLMQLMPATARFVVKNIKYHFTGYELFKSRDLRDRELTPDLLMEPFINTTLGIAYLAWLRDNYKRYLPYYVLVAYNLGPARLNDLLSRKAFRPAETKKYFQAIQSGIHRIRFYQKNQTPSSFLRKKRVSSVTTI